MTENEFSLYKELIKQILLHYIDHLRWPIDKDYADVVNDEYVGLQFYSPCVSDYEIALDELISTELISNSEPYEVLRSFDHIENIRSLADTDNLKRALTGFIGMCGCYRNSYGFSISPNAFGITDQFVPVFYFLQQCGYAIKIGEKYGWTDKIAPIMVERVLWHFGTIAEERLYQNDWETGYHNKLIQMISTMPDNVRSRLNIENKNLAANNLSREIAARWNGSNWIENEPEFAKRDSAFFITYASDIIDIIISGNF